MADDLPALPDLHFTDRHGHSVALSGLLASGPAVLYFLRAASCPGLSGARAAARGGALGGTRPDRRWSW